MYKQCGNDAAVARIVCPYFHHLERSGRIIICEFPEKGKELCMRFSRREGLHKHLAYACNSFDYGVRCPIAALLEKLANE